MTAEEVEDEQDEAEREEVYEFLATQRARHDATLRVEAGVEERGQSLSPSMSKIDSVYLKIILIPRWESRNISLLQ